MIMCSCHFPVSTVLWVVLIKTFTHSPRYQLSDVQNSSGSAQIVDGL